MNEGKEPYGSGDLWLWIDGALGRSEPVVLATIIGRVGSGPREAGASMAVLRDGRTLGTVGGGLLEARVLESAAEVHRNCLPVLRRFSLTADAVDAGGMLCGGELEVLIDYLDPAVSPCAEIVARLLERRGEGRFVWLGRSIAESGDGAAPKTGIGLIEEEGLTPGSLDPACLDEARLMKERRRGEAVLMDCGGVRCFVQPVGIHQTVFIFGAGHIALALAPICTLTGFRTVIIDDRPEYAVPERFPTAAEIRVVHSYSDEIQGLEIDRSGYGIIVTHAHAHDRDVLARLLKSDAAYIGMIASRRKREIIFTSLKDEGVGEDELRRVHSPIGLDIGARTPAEIAVSIAAELIAVRAGKIP